MSDGTTDPADAAEAIEQAAPATGAAVRDLLAAVGELERRLRQGDRALDDETGQLEGYRWLFSILQVGLEAFVWADREAPRFVEIVGPYKKWGGDNADAFYEYVRLDPSRTYRVLGAQGRRRLLLADRVRRARRRPLQRAHRRLGQRPGRLAPGDDGFFEIILSPEDHEATPWIRLEPDAVCAITRDYLDDPGTGRRVEWHIECLDGDPRGWQVGDGELAERFRATTTWIEEQAGIVPVRLEEPNTVAEPYPVPEATFGWAAGDAAYAMGSFELAPDQAMVIRGRSPECAFWNVCLWNELLHTFNYDYSDRSGQVTRNGSQVTLRRGRELGAGGVGPRPGAPQLAVHPGPRPRPGLVPVVPARAHPRAPHHRGGAGGVHLARSALSLESRPDQPLSARGPPRTGRCSRGIARAAPRGRGRSRPGRRSARRGGGGGGCRGRPRRRRGPGR